MPTPIDIQLRITNLGKSEVSFPTFDTFGLKISNAEGKRIMPSGGRDATILTRPKLLPAGASYSLSRKAELRWDDKTKTSALAYYDGTGSEHHFGPLAPGRYKVGFWYSVGAKTDFNTKRDPTSWLGEVVSDEVLIEVFSR